MPCVAVIVAVSVPSSCLYSALCLESHHLYFPASFVLSLSPLHARRHAQVFMLRRVHRVDYDDDRGTDLVPGPSQVCPQFQVNVERWMIYVECGGCHFG